MSGAEPGIGGRLDGRVHIFPLRVYYEDTDTAGLVYHANYLRFAERGRTEMLRALGIGQAALAERHGLGFAVRECTIDFRRAARLDDLLEVRSRLTALRGASLGMDQDIRRDGAPVAHLRMRIACLSRQGRPAPIPGAIRDTLQPYVQSRELD